MSNRVYSGSREMITDHDLIVATFAFFLGGAAFGREMCVPLLISLGFGLFVARVVATLNKP